MRFPMLKMARKRYCLFLLGVYLVLFGIYLLLTRHSRSVEHINAPSHEIYSVDLHGFFNQSIQKPVIETNTGLRILDSYLQNHTIDHSRPCFSPYNIPIGEPLKMILEQMKMLPYFNIGSQYLMSVPSWQHKIQSPKPTNKTKYYLTAVLRIRLYEEDPARWTIRELKQWLHYQFWAGTEHVYICYHFLNESEKFEHHLKEYLKRGLVSMIPWNNITSVPKTKTYDEDNVKNQVSCYNYVLKQHKEEAVWHYNFDMDENPYVPGDSCEGFLTRYLKKLDPNTSELKLANFVFQGQGDRTRDVFYDRINRRTPKPLNGNVKPVYKVQMTTNAGMHGSQTTGRQVYPDHKDLIMIHYWGARAQKWQNDTDELYQRTVECNDIRNTIAVNVRHSLVAFGDLDAFSTKTGP